MEVMEQAEGAWSLPGRRTAGYIQPEGKQVFSVLSLTYKRFRKQPLTIIQMDDSKQ